MKICKCIINEISIKSEDAILLRGWMLCIYFFFIIRTLLVFTVLMAKFPNRSASILLEPIVYLPYTGKGPSGYHISHRNNTLYLKFSSVPAKCSSSESFCCQMQSCLKSGQYNMKVCWRWHNMILHFCQTLVGMFEEEHAKADMAAKQTLV